MDGFIRNQKITLQFCCEYFLEMMDLDSLFGLRDAATGKESLFFNS